jgi:hypothetical protein
MASPSGSDDVLPESDVYDVPTDSVPPVPVIAAVGTRFVVASVAVTGALDARLLSVTTNCTV